MLEEDCLSLTEHLPLLPAVRYQATADGGSEITRTFDINTSAEDRILTFTNTPKQDVPIHKEAIKTNYIIIPNQ